MIEVKENLYLDVTLATLIQDAKDRLINPKKINKVGNKFTDSELTSVITKPFDYLQCSHWYTAYFQHITPVYPHTDNDNENMLYVGIIPLFWNTIKEVSTVVYRETNKTKIIYSTKDSFTEWVSFTWRLNAGIIFDANLVHSSGQFTGMKTGIQIIGYR